MPKVLVIGNGGREHAICEALKRSPLNPEIINFASAINPGIHNVCQEVIIGDI
ncbi:MAG TPA: phosphoribosylamine--glycine ligase, partial [Candidatus Gracilibacteria bacterium]